MIKAIPNLLTLSRILCGPLLFYLMVEDYHHQENPSTWLIILIVMVYAFVTDYVDGWLARKLDAVSHIGAMLDPIADKILITTMLFGIAVLDLVNFPGYFAAILIVSREFIIAGVREYSGFYKIKLPVTQLAKFKTTAQMVAVFIIFLEHRYVILSGVSLGEFLLICSAIMSVVTGIQYFRKTMIELKKIPSSNG